MGMTIWWFARTEPGKLKRVPATRMDAFFEGQGAATDVVDGYLYCVEAVVTFASRVAEDVPHVEFVREPVDERGFLARDWRRDLLEEREEWLRAREGAVKGAPVVLHAAARMKRNRYRWKPTKADLAALREEVTRAAGWKVPIWPEERGARR